MPEIYTGHVLIGIVDFAKYLVTKSIWKSIFARVMDEGVHILEISQSPLLFIMTADNFRAFVKNLALSSRTSIIIRYEKWQVINIIT
jgi:hypothetical protein